MRLCIPTLCRYDLLARLIESAEAGTVKPTGYYIIDNGGGFDVTTMGRAFRRLASEPPDSFANGVSVHRPRQNLGVAPSWNKFLSLREPVIVSNDDIVLRPHAIETIARELETRSFVQAFGFALFGITPECVERVGYFDEKFYPAYFEDCDYEIRMRRAGVLRSRYAEGELAEHDGWSTTEKVREADGEEKTEWLTKAPEKNRVYFVQKWGAVTGHCSGGGDDPPEIFNEPFNGSPPADWASEQRCPPKPMRWDIINRIAGIIGAVSYLEIGVADGESMRHVDIPIRHGVDPMPSPGGQRACTTYFPYSSRFFFEELSTDESKLKQYDVVFIDGDHKAELVYYEIQKALELVSPKGVIVIHDCNPATEAMQTDEYQGGLWNGTVWKAIARLRAEGKHALRVVDSDYGVGILVPRGEFDPGNTVPIDEANPWKGLSYEVLEAGRSWMLGLTSGWDWEEWFRKQWALYLTCEVCGRRESAPFAPDDRCPLCGSKLRQDSVEYVEYDPTMHNEEQLKLSGYTTAGFYHYDETGAYMYGPFATSEQAHAAFQVYLKEIESKEEEEPSLKEEPPPSDLARKLACPHCGEVHLDACRERES